MVVEENGDKKYIMDVRKQENTIILGVGDWIATPPPPTTNREPTTRPPELPPQWQLQWYGSGSARISIVKLLVTPDPDSEVKNSRNWTFLTNNATKQ